MCGIYGVIGNCSTKAILNNLEKLQYRGYDSCGLMYNTNNKYELKKVVGNVDVLRKEVHNKEVSIGIAHTRWATHGLVNKENCHPHTSKNKRFYVVHNGVIDNYIEIKNKYSFDLITDTDTEVIPFLLDLFIINNDYKKGLQSLQNELKGTYALVILDTKENKLLFLKKCSPLLLGIGKNKIVISSDQIAFDQGMNIIILNDYDYGFISLLDYQIFTNKANEKWKTFYKAKDSCIVKKTKYYMLDEILVQPNVINKIASLYVNIDTSDFVNSISKSDEIIFIGAGSSFYASKVLAYLYEKEIKKRCFAVVASEFIGSFNILNDKCTYILLSQSGETADLCDCLKYLKDKNIKIYSLCNIVNSTIGYNSDLVYPLFCDEEISVASTKAFTSMIYVGSLLLNKTKYIEKRGDIINDLQTSLERFSELNNIINAIVDSDNVFFIGKGIDYILALEAALKLREVAYINSYAFESGELKHGSIALINYKSVCIGLCTNDSNNINSNLEEVKCRGGRCFILNENSIYNIIPKIQMIAFLAAKKLNRNIDQPKNLAKSVTVK